jgi:hypothetical protein
MNKNALIFFAVVSSLSMTLAIIASLIFTMDGIYAIWTFPAAFLFFYTISFFVSRYKLINKAQYQKMDNFFARFNPVAAIPNMATIRPHIALVAPSIIFLFASALLLLGAITQK